MYWIALDVKATKLQLKSYLSHEIHKERENEKHYNKSVKQLWCKEQSGKDTAAERVHVAPMPTEIPAAEKHQRDLHCPEISMHRQLWPWLPCLREQLVQESDIHRFLRLLRLFILFGIYIAFSLEVKCMGLNCQSVLLRFFIAIGSQVGKKLQPTKKTPKSPKQKTRKATSSLKITGQR